MHQFENLRHDQRCEAGGRLVHEEQFRLGHQGPADGAHLLLTAGNSSGGLLAAVLQSRKKVVDPIELLGETSPRLAERRHRCAGYLPRSAAETADGSPAHARFLSRPCDAPADRRLARPSSVITPPRSGIRPEMTRISVVLPAPFGPITPTASPCGTSARHRTELGRSHIRRKRM